MKRWVFYISILLSIPCSSQYYLKGDVRDEQGRSLPNVKILLASKGSYPYYSGSSGAFGIPTNKLIDTILLSLDGFETIKKAADASRYQSFILQPASATKLTHISKLLSVTHNLLPLKSDDGINRGNESYSTLAENTFVDAKNYAETGFALNIDRASYSNIRRFLRMNYRVPTDAVRIEEMLNYFNFSNNNNDTVNYTFKCSTQLTSAPWDRNNQLLFINLQAPKLNFRSVPPTNLTFLIDVSGSMDKENRLPLLKSAFKLLVQNLRYEDTVAIVVYGGGVNIVLQPTSGNEKEKIIDAVDKLEANGDTPGEAAIKTAYKLAERMFNRKGNNRVILATDGDFNVGQTSEEELEDMITTHRQSGIYLTCLGVGMGNYKDSKLEVLAKKGNGNFAYIDDLDEGEKVLVKEFSKTLYSVADDAFLSVKFNPKVVNQYRLIGFDNKKDALEDSTTQFIGGEIGSGHTLIAVFEIEPTGKYRENVTGIDAMLADLQLQYKLPSTNVSRSQHFEIPLNYVALEKADSCYRFAASVTMFGSLLRQSKYAKNYSWDDVKALALSASAPGNFLQQQFIELIEKARKIYSDKKKGLFSVKF